MFLAEVFGFPLACKSWTHSKQNVIPVNDRTEP